MCVRPTPVDAAHLPDVYILMALYGRMVMLMAIMIIIGITVNRDLRPPILRASGEDEARGRPPSLERLHRH